MALLGFFLQLELIFLEIHIIYTRHPYAMTSPYESLKDAIDSVLSYQTPHGRRRNYLCTAAYIRSIHSIYLMDRHTAVRYYDDLSVFQVIPGLKTYTNNHV